MRHKIVEIDCRCYFSPQSYKDCEGHHNQQHFISVEELFENGTMFVAGIIQTFHFTAFRTSQVYINSNIITPGLINQEKEKQSANRSTSKAKMIG